jgi:hypothetical protein
MSSTTPLTLEEEVKELKRINILLVQRLEEIANFVDSIYNATKKSSDYEYNLQTSEHMEWKW